MNRTALNKKARKKIADYCREHNITRCEMKLDGCLGEAHHPAHKHKRNWYKGKPDELLWDRDEWLAACVRCHMATEYNKDLHTKVFCKNVENNN